ncbi:Lipase maturation factor 1 [Chelonia mydas]|uniref:Lipase maturation factor 1 n=1 Tax=Chelonia mydas TaxID=8469 RepID=M7BIM7_CHEMY|nr:Lipase maturation factor 1 [Chelonia mydas]
MDRNLDYLAGLGLGVSAYVLVTGCANMILMAILWILYLSLVNVGQIWLGPVGHTWGRKQIPGPETGTPGRQQSPPGPAAG